MISKKTAEYRWFFPFEYRNELEEWFRRTHRKILIEPERKDLYLVLRPDRDLGIKLREDRLEVKYRSYLHPDNETAIARKYRLQLWQKESMFFKRDSEFRIINPPWLEIKKNRTLSILVPEGSGTEVDFSRLVRNIPCCQLELTVFEVLDRKYCTYGVEIDDLENIEIYRDFIDNLISGYTAPWVDSESSYPEFIAAHLM